jgi:hypothetical protein
MIPGVHHALLVPSDPRLRKASYTFRLDAETETSLLHRFATRSGAFGFEGVSALPWTLHLDAEGRYRQRILPSLESQFEFPLAVALGLPLGFEFSGEAHSLALKYTFAPWWSGLAVRYAPQNSYQSQGLALTLFTSQVVLGQEVLANLEADAFRRSFAARLRAGRPFFIGLEGERHLREQVSVAQGLLGVELDIGNQFSLAFAVPLRAEFGDFENRVSTGFFLRLGMDWRLEKGQGARKTLVSKKGGSTLLWSQRMVSNQEYRAYCKETGRRCPVRTLDSARGEESVLGVSLKEARSYAKWAGGRLPTALEWQAMAKQGRSGAEREWAEAEVEDAGVLVGVCPLPCAKPERFVEVSDPKANPSVGFRVVWTPF